MARPKMVGPGVVFAEVTIDPGSVAANVTLDVTATVKGLKKGHPVLVWAPSLEANLNISNAHCSAANTVKFRLGNHTAAPIDPASQAFSIVQI